MKCCLWSKVVCDERLPKAVKADISNPFSLVSIELIEKLNIVAVSNLPRVFGAGEKAMRSRISGDIIGQVERVWGQRRMRSGDRDDGSWIPGISEGVGL